MDEERSPTEESAPEEMPQDEPRSTRRLRIMVAFVAVVLIGVAVVAALMLRSKDEPEPEFIVRAGPIADLLGWLPADVESRQAFAVWIADPGLATPMTGVEATALQSQLAMEPAPLTLGRSAGWLDAFGWDVSRISGWATAGSGSVLTVLTGDFDGNAIGERLIGTGYDRDAHRGVTIYVRYEFATPAATLDGDSMSAANVVAVLDGRLITAATRERVEAAIDAAIDGGSLIDIPTISAMVDTLHPLSALAAVDQARLAADCNLGSIPAGDFEIARSSYAVVGYGRLGDGGERRTLIALSFPDESIAIEAAPGFEEGWVDGFANAGGAGGGIAAYGRLTVVTRTNNILVAELVDGRDDGWVRSGIRYAIPVCEAVIELVASATPAVAD